MEQNYKAFLRVTTTVLRFERKVTKRIDTVSQKHLDTPSAFAAKLGTSGRFCFYLLSLIFIYTTIQHCKLIFELA